MARAHLQSLGSGDSFINPKDLPTLNKEEGSSFGWTDRMFFGWRDGLVFDYGDWEARDLAEMMGKDYKARQIENVLCLPILSAERTMQAAKGDTGEFELLQAFWEHGDELNDGCETPLDLIVDQMTSAIIYKKAFFEVVWDSGTGDFEGKIVPRKYGWRPQTTCRAMRDPKTGDLHGFEQESYYTGPEMSKGIWPIKVEQRNAFIYIHGARRDPINGVSDLEIPYWAYKTKQKILFLWFQFLEGVSLPRVVVKANDPEEADRVGRQIARAKSSGVITAGTGGNPASLDITQLNLSGNGADQFTAAIKWLDATATESVLAGFLDLTSHTTRGAGPVGVHLAKDAGDFFLQSLEAKTREMAGAIRRDVFAPFLRYNLGPKAKIPAYKFEPLNSEDKSASVAMLQALMASRDPALVPDEFVGELAAQVADYIGLDATKVESSFHTAAVEFKAHAAKQEAAMASQMGQQVAGVAGVVGKAAQMVKQAKTPTGPQPTE